MRRRYLPAINNLLLSAGQWKQSALGWLRTKLIRTEVSLPEQQELCILYWPLHLLMGYPNTKVLKHCPNIMKLFFGQTLSVAVAFVRFN